MSARPHSEANALATNCSDGRVVALGAHAERCKLEASLGSGCTGLHLHPLLTVAFRRAGRWTG
ncbi:hypothetical protein GGTG_09500 [Gaeumannomyces tritici R3-111a-1]|uniref:Uncharacterized protein n=1 Tax=Gaeumannomyces tritici (strain R3-111a-1) TaxID=644352 RepID=J3P7K8_GAET3|nr:hypothetical protein GGTG_09500 [Gaeumannomyces tritici R3-111a-1]EJT72640.1 hypothetical protein GGTG_09500 [Gaeumannomyces tritici R3-111a-1]